MMASSMRQTAGARRARARPRRSVEITATSVVEPPISDHHDAARARRWTRPRPTPPLSEREAAPARRAPAPRTASSSAAPLHARRALDIETTTPVFLQRAALAQRLFGKRAHQQRRQCRYPPTAPSITGEESSDTSFGVRPEHLPGVAPAGRAPRPGHRRAAST